MLNILLVLVLNFQSFSLSLHCLIFHSRCFFLLLKCIEFQHYSFFLKLNFHLYPFQNFVFLCSLHKLVIFVRIINHLSNTVIILNIFVWWMIEPLFHLSQYNQTNWLFCMYFWNTANSMKKKLCYKLMKWNRIVSFVYKSILNNIDWTEYNNNKNKEKLEARFMKRVRRAIQTSDKIIQSNFSCSTRKAFCISFSCLKTTVHSLIVSIVLGFCTFIQSRICYECIDIEQNDE